MAKVRKAANAIEANTKAAAANSRIGKPACPPVAKPVAVPQPVGMGTGRIRRKQRKDGTIIYENPVVVLDVTGETPRDWRSDLAFKVSVKTALTALVAKEVAKYEKAGKVAKSNGDPVTSIWEGILSVSQAFTIYTCERD